MNLQSRGTSTLTNNEVTNISKFGIWIIIDDIEYFISFEDYPQFKNATVEQILSFETLSPTQLYWKSIDCDIEIDALINPQQFPLKFKSL